MDTTQPHQNAGGSGVATAAVSSHHHQRTASISALPTRKPSSAGPSSPQSPNQNQIKKQTNFPQHFIVRPSVTKHTANSTVTIPGPIVPLIAVDQLPEWLDLFGVPRELSLEQTVGLSNLGTVIRSPEFYEVYMHTDLDISPVVTNGPNNENYRRVDHHHEDRSNPLLISSDVDTSGPHSSSSSELSMPTSPLISRMDPATKGLASSRHAYINETDKKAGGSNNGGSNASTKKHTNAPSQQATPMSQGHYQRVPSPTVAGSTPPTNQPPYPLIHPSFPHPQLHPPPYPSPHHHAAYPIPPPPLPASVHPADRMLYSWTPPSQHKSKSNSTSTSSRQKTPSASNPNPNNGNGTNTSNSTTNSMYCKHWCHRGTCRWGAQCRYAHLMPGTAEGLREVGLSHHPAWYTTAYNMMYGTPGFGAWYAPPHPPPHPHLPHLLQSGKHYGGGGGRKAQKDKEREKERKEAAAVAAAAVEKGKEREREREKGKMVEGRGQGVVAGAGAGIGSEGDASRGGAAPESGKRVEASQNQPKKDGVKENIAAVGGQEQRKPEQPEQPEEVPKLVEI
ncbi:hypothetical protein F4806DRAFT_98155 [Annulohypoxylon nitens]|nr:hypothetical protein F4806DRAFT_98155 [Annulohypoxylon nitens]